MSAKMIILLMLVSTTAFGQLQGKFCYGDVFEVRCITFLENNQFEYYIGHCTGASAGAGTYKIRHKKLILEFETDSTAELGYEAALVREPTDSDTITLEVNVFEHENKEPIPATVWYNHGRLRIGQVADVINGQCTLKIPRAAHFITLGASYLGYNNYSDSIRADANYKITLYLKDSFYDLMNRTDNEVYKIKNMEENSFQLKGRGTRVQKYVRMKEETETEEQE